MDSFENALERLKANFPRGVPDDGKPEQPAVIEDADAKDRFIAALEHMAEEAECAHMYLDDLNVPRADAGGKVFSLVGRIKAHANSL